MLGLSTVETLQVIELENPAAGNTYGATPRIPLSVKKKSSIKQQPFGALDGKNVSLYTLANENGLEMSVMTYGAIITQLFVPDRNGKLSDVVLGFEDLEGYRAKSPYFGATCGRLGNRIFEGKFTLDGRAYSVATNDAPHHLHGGNKGWDKVVWDAEALETERGPSIRFTYVSKNGEEGYPGTVTAHSVYTLTNDDELVIEMSAVTDARTLVNMLHHSYWNLGGFGSGPITDHELLLEADEYTPGDPTVPTGRIEPVKGTPFDFSKGKPIGKDLIAAGGEPVGFDHNFVVRGEPNTLRKAATLRDPKSGRVLTIFGDQPAVQFYSGKFLDGSIRGKGVAYEKYGGLCLETQKFPNSINVPAWEKDVILDPGQTYRHSMIHRFSTE
jgi:aldose 1-epimerase